MLYFREVGEYLRYYAGQDFRMIQLVRMLGGKPADQKEWERKRKAIRRCLEELVRMGFVIERPPKANGGFKTYRWKPGHDTLENREEIRDNTHQAKLCPEWTQ